MIGSTSIWLDGVRTSSLPLPDRALDFGDGLFETMLLHKGNPLFFKYHLARLALGLQILGIADCLKDVESQVAQAARATSVGRPWTAMRLSVLRGPGPRGYAPATNSVPRILIYASEIARDCTKIERHAVLNVSATRLSLQPRLARIKHLCRIEQVLAAMEAQNERVDESVMLDHTGHIGSVIAGNIFLVSNGKLLTPKLHECGVAGTRRQLIIEKWAPAIGLEVLETRLSLDDLFRADEVFYSNSLQTVRPIVQIGEHRWEFHETCESLFQCFLKDLP